MAEDPRTYQPSTVNSNRSAMQGNGFGQSDMDMQQEPNRDQQATNPQRTDAFDNDQAGSGDDRGRGSSDMGSGAVSRGGGDASGASMEDRSFASEEGVDDDRDGTGVDNSATLREGTPANVDIHKLGQSDNPQQEWGDPAEGATYSSTNANRGGRTELERGQGAKTRAFNKDQVSRRT